MIRSLTTLALSLAATAAIPSIASAHDRDDYRFRDRNEYRFHDRDDYRFRDREVVVVREREECRDFDVSVSLRDVPPAALDAVDCERHGRPIESVQYVRRDGKLFYRFRIDDRDHHGRHNDFNIRVQPSGRILSVADAEPDFHAWCR